MQELFSLYQTAATVFVTERMEASMIESLVLLTAQVVNRQEEKYVGPIFDFAVNCSFKIKE